jgi:DNA-binding response OmpR family regulator
MRGLQYTPPLSAIGSIIAVDVKNQQPMTEQLSAQPTVLIVEDEMLVRMFAVDALEDAGFQVLQAGDAAEAMTALVGADHVQAVIVDMGLPDRSGDQLAAEMRARRQDLPILIASGRSERELKDRFASDSRVGVLVKPYTASMLVGALGTLGVKAPNPQD